MMHDIHTQPRPPAPPCRPPRTGLVALVTAVAIGLSGLMAAAPVAQAQGTNYRNMSCDQLWYARNLIFARQGYCFQTARAIAVFGPRCYPPYGRLTAAQDRQVAQIRRWERRKGCN